MYRAINIRRSSTSTSTQTLVEKTRSLSVTQAQPDAPAKRRSTLASLPLRLNRTKSSGKTLAKLDEHGDVSTTHNSIPNRLHDLFFSLPHEVLALILCNLTTLDVLNLRLTTRDFKQVTDYNAATISRRLLPTVLADHKEDCDDADMDDLYLTSLYPAPVPQPDLRFFLTVLHADAAVRTCVTSMTDFIQTKIYMIRSHSRAKQFAPSRHRMLSRLHAPTSIVYNFLHLYRRACLEESGTVRNALIPQSRRTDVSTPNMLQDALIQRYPAAHLEAAVQFFKILVSAMRQKLRPPTYAGTLERRLRGWSRPPAADADIAVLLLLGGLESVTRVISLPKYAARLEALHSFLDKAEHTEIVKLGLAAAPSGSGSGNGKAPASANTNANANTNAKVPPRPPLDLLDIFVLRAEQRLITSGHITSRDDIGEAFEFIQDIIHDRRRKEIGANPADMAIDEPVDATDFDERMEDNGADSSSDNDDEDDDDARDGNEVVFHGPPRTGTLATIEQNADRLERSNSAMRWRILNSQAAGRAGLGQAAPPPPPPPGGYGGHPLVAPGRMTFAPVLNLAGF